MLLAQLLPAQATNPCIPYPELIETPPCAIEHVSGRTRIVKSHVVFRPFNRYGLAAARTREDGFVYINRQGWVIVPHVAVYDNGADYFHHGIVRINDGGKWGLSDFHGRFVVPLTYDGLLDPASGSGETWLACKGCVVGKLGEYSYFHGGDWFKLDLKGRLLGKTEDPTPASPQPPQPPS
jgi:hypothetical protein